MGGEVNRPSASTWALVKKFTGCADLVLGRWLGEDYRIPGEPAPTAEDRGNEDAFPSDKD